MLKVNPVLLVEDTEEDAVLFRLQFGSTRIRNPLKILSDGESALCYLKGEGIYADREVFPSPAMIFLDLKLPRVGGFAVLESLQLCEHRDLPVIVLANFIDMKRRNEALQKGAKAFLVKPVSAGELLSTIRSLEDVQLHLTKDGFSIENVGL